MEEEFVEMERKVDVTSKAISEVINLTKEYLQPNPAARTKLNMISTYQKMQGKQKDAKYPQAEDSLGLAMAKYGKELGTESNFGVALERVGDGMTQLGEIKDSLDFGVKQQFLDPLQQLCDKDIKEVMHHRKKLSGRRLDYDYKRKRGTKVPPEEVTLAEQKLEESLELADSSMFNLLSGDIEQVSQLAALVESQLDYHRQSADILESIHEDLQKQINEIHAKPERERTKKQLRTPSLAAADRPPTSAPLPTPSPQHNVTSPTKPKAKASQPCCRALYDFEPENEGELGFKEDEVITLVSRIDENWYEGMNTNGETGYFPVSYVEVILELP
uniref:Endophilin-A2 n=1 Tax=Phallusia mammillata TaxID=59560 RepID=A0A6F9DT46_9ASCI|nr:endophilin-A2 [Phallusia mammillata]